MARAIVVATNTGSALRWPLRAQSPLWRNRHLRLWRLKRSVARCLGLEGRRAPCGATITRATGGSSGRSREPDLATTHEAADLDDVLDLSPDHLAGPASQPSMIRCLPQIADGIEAGLRSTAHLVVEPRSVWP